MTQTPTIIIGIDSEVHAAFCAWEFASKEEKYTLFHLVTKKIPWNSLSTATKAEMLFAIIPYRHIANNQADVEAMIATLVSSRDIYVLKAGNLTEKQEDVLMEYLMSLDFRWLNMSKIRDIAAFSKKLANYMLNKLLSDDYDIYEIVEVIKNNRWLTVKNLLNTKILEDPYNVQYLMRQFPELEKYHSML